MRLIDADKYKGKVICNHTYSGVKKLINIDDVPTAYDIDKVVEELKSEVERWEDSGKEYGDKCEIAVARGLRNAIKIVKKFVVNDDLYTKLAEYEDLEKKGLLLMLPCNVGDTVYVLAECKNVNLVLDGTMYDRSGGYGTATGYYCPYELNDTCPHIDFDDCKEFEDKTAVFADTVVCIDYDETGITLQCENTNVCGYIGEYIFLTREEAEQKLKEMESEQK